MAGLSPAWAKRSRFQAQTHVAPNFRVRHSAVRRQLMASRFHQTKKLIGRPLGYQGPISPGGNMHRAGLWRNVHRHFETPPFSLTFPPCCRPKADSTSSIPISWLARAAIQLVFPCSYSEAGAALKIESSIADFSAASRTSGSRENNAGREKRKGSRLEYAPPQPAIHTQLCRDGIGVSRRFFNGGNHGHTW